MQSLHFRQSHHAARFGKEPYVSGKLLVCGHCRTQPVLKRCGPVLAMRSNQGVRKREGTANVRSDEDNISEAPRPLLPPRIGPVDTYSVLFLLECLIVYCWGTALTPTITLLAHGPGK